jgi:hypothetical protein
MQYSFDSFRNCGFYKLKIGSAIDFIICFVIGLYSSPTICEDLQTYLYTWIPIEKAARKIQRHPSFSCHA